MQSIRNARLIMILFVRNFGRNLGWVFVILFEVLFIEIQEEIHHFAGWEGGGVKGHKNREEKFCEQTGVS